MRDEQSGLQLGCVGNFGWWPNRNGLRWFLHEVFSRTCPDTRLHLFGEETAAVAPKDARIVDHGFVRTTHEIWKHCGFMICPTHSGGGVNVKFAEAIYNRVPVLTSPFGARGLSLADDAGIVVRESANEWVSFLGSPSAMDLAHLRVPLSIADAFSMGAHVERMTKFVNEVMLKSKRSK